MNDSNNTQSRFNLLRGRQRRRVISGYQVSDIHSTQPVEIADGSTLVGNIFAPEVHIAGLVYGTIVAKETAVYQNGQLWGDLYTISLEIESGGKVHGWVGTLSAISYREYSQKLRLPAPETKAAPEEAAERNLKIHNEEQLISLKLLQTETAVALAGRAELEQSFDKRLSELAGNISAQNNRLKADLAAATAALADLRPQAAVLENELQSRDEQIAEQIAELNVARDLLAARQEDLDAMAEELSVHHSNYENLQTNKLEAEEGLNAAREEIANVTEKQRNLETALQASLAHATDLEESLLRWQELAEFNESQMQESQEHVEFLQNELDETRAALEKQNK